MAKRILLVTISLTVVGEIFSDIYLIFTTGTEYLLPLFCRLLITVSLGWLILKGRSWVRWILLIFILNNIAFAGVTLWESYSGLTSLSLFSLWIILLIELGAAILVISSHGVKYIHAR